MHGNTVSIIIKKMYKIKNYKYMYVQMEIKTSYWKL